MPFSNRVRTNLEDWANSVSPAPRCRECDKPVDFKSTTNQSEIYMGTEQLPLCEECAIHYVIPLWPFGANSCMRRRGTGISTRTYKQITCGDCRRNEEARQYILDLMEYPPYMERVKHDLV